MIATAPALPDTADLAMIARPFPARDALAPITHDAVVALVVARCAWWLDVATAYLALMEDGCADAIHDARSALASAQTYAPR